MKKLIMAVAMTAVMAVSASAFAATTATYNQDNQSVTVGETTENYTTVLITDVSGNIVYVNQNDSGIGAAAKFLMKNPTVQGEYTLKMGGSTSGASVTTIPFTVSQDAVEGLRGMTKIEKSEEGADGTKNVGFTFNDTVIINEYNSIAVQYSGGTLYYPLNTLFGSALAGNTKFGVQINGVPNDEESNLKVSLAKKVAVDQRTQSTNE